jgi:hypothetical protein
MSPFDATAALQSRVRCGCVRGRPEYAIHSCAPTGEPGGIHDIDTFCPCHGGRARNGGKCLFIDQLVFFGNRRIPWHGRGARPRGNNGSWRTIWHRRNEWLRRGAQPGWPGWSNRKRRQHCAGNGWSKRDWRAHRPGKWRSGHRGAVGDGRRRGRGGIDRHRGRGGRCHRR